MLQFSTSTRRLTRFRTKGYYKLDHYGIRGNLLQELSYRKQIARELRTQYVQGIHRPNITP